MTQKRLLLGIHSISMQDVIKQSAEREGYNVDKTMRPEEMLEQSRKGEHDVYLMDLNLGYPGSENITPAINVYDAVRKRVEKGEARFLGISNTYDAVTRAKEKNIPCESSMSVNLIDFLGLP